MLLASILLVLPSAYLHYQNTEPQQAGGQVVVVVTPLGELSSRPQA